VSANKLCVLIPAFNEELGLGPTISSIVEAGILLEDIYVVDDCSTDITSQVAVSFGVNLLRNVQNVGKAKSLRAAFTHFNLIRYTYIALMDADTAVDGQYFREIEKAFLVHPQVSIIFGQVKNRAHGWIAARRCSDYWIGQKIWKEAQSKYGVVTVCPGCASVYLTLVFAMLDWQAGADTHVEDCYVTIESAHMGLQAIYFPKCVLFTPDPIDYRDYWKQNLRWNKGLFTVAAKLHMWRGMKKVDLEFKMLALEGIIFSTIVLLFPFWMIVWRPALYALALEISFMLIVANIVAIVEHRIDVLLYSPLFIVLRLTDCANFLYSFVSVALGHQEKSWFHPKRFKNKEIA
jgi:cellulose synthase/poly-beta-1,6-N-acetylglucosamine synthase-like glycosyltransferase